MGFDSGPEEELPEWAKPGKVTKRKGYVQLVTNMGELNIEVSSEAHAHSLPTRSASDTDDASLSLARSLDERSFAATSCPRRARTSWGCVPKDTTTA